MFARSMDNASSMLADTDRPPSADLVQPGGVGTADDATMEGEQRYKNPVKFDTFDNDVYAEDGMNNSKKLTPGTLENSFKSFDNDVERAENRLPVQRQKRAPTEAQLRAAFNTVDKDRSGELDREEVGEAAKQLGQIFTDQELTETVNMMDDDGNVNGFVDFEEFASFWLGKNWWDKADNDKISADDAPSLFAQKCNTFTRKLSGRGNLESTAKTKEKQVEPESIFVIASDINQGNRERAELMDKIQEMHESDFHRLEDAFMTYAESQVNEMVWNSTCAANFIEEQVIEGLGWQTQHVDTAKKALQLAVEEQAEVRSDLGGLSKAFLASVCWRCFLKEELAHKPTAGKQLHRQASWDDTGSSPVSEATVGSTQKVADAARSFISSSKGELEIIFDLETMPLDDAVEAVITSLEEESHIRTNKIQGLVARQQSLEENRKTTGRTYTPRRVKVSGLQGDAAAANGIYCADGLRASWNRPVYIQEEDSAHGGFLHYMWYDQQLVPDEKTGSTKWGNGSWSIGPTQNGDRCTAYLLEDTKDGVTQQLMHPAMGKNVEVKTFWNVFDVVQKKWRTAPGDHCPSFSVTAVDGETIQDYISTSIAEQTETCDKMKRLIAKSNFRDKVRRNLRNFSKLKSEGGGIDRKSFNDYVKKFHEKELRKMQTSIIVHILAANDESRLTLPRENDLSENYLLVQAIVNKFMSSCEQKKKLRMIQKRRFLTRMNRPAMSKAFFSVCTTRTS